MNVTLTLKSYLRALSTAEHNLILHLCRSLTEIGMELGTLQTGATFRLSMRAPVALFDGALNLWEIFDGLFYQN